MNYLGTNLGAMNPSFERTTASSLHRSAADNSSQDGIAVPAVLSPQVVSEETSAAIEEPLLPVADKGTITDIEEPLSTDQDNETTANIEEPLVLDMDEDGVDEQHTLLLEDDILYLHSDKQTLSLFIARKRGRKGAKALTKQEATLLAQIEQLSITVHTGRYGTKAQGGKKRIILQQDRLNGTKALKKIAQLLSEFNQISEGPNMAMKKKRPPSHESQLVTKTIQGDTFCEKVVMAPLSIALRDDPKRGSPPEEETKLWRRLTNLAHYKRGHMLNEQLHGPGINSNLVPISTAFNNKMRATVEHVTKEAVNANNKVVHFEAEALNWGSFKGAFGAPDERLLPSHFRFRVTQMTLIPGKKYDGSHFSHWEKNTSKKIIFDETLKHDIPTDVVPGNVAFTTKTFAPGFYFHPSGNIQRASPTEYLLRGYFSVNNKSALFPALAMDDSNKLSYNIISENVTTKYEVPPGYDIVSPFGPEELEYILYNDEIKKTTSDTPAFLIINTNRHASLKNEFAEEKRLARERVKVRNQIVLDQQAIKEQERKRLEAQRKLEQEENEQRLKEQKKSDGFRRLLYSTFREEAYKYEPEFNDVYLENFEHYREKILYQAGEEWKKNNQLYIQDKNGLLAPLVQELIKIKDRLLEKQIVYEKKEELKRQEEERQREEEEKLRLEQEQKKDAIIKHLLQQLHEKATNDHYPKIPSEAGEQYYRGEKRKLVATYIRFWRKDTNVLKSDSNKLLTSPLNKLEKIYEKALTVPDIPVNDQALPPSGPVKRKLEISHEENIQEERDRPVKKIVPDDHFTYSPSQSGSPSLQIPPPFNYSRKFNNNQDRMEEEEKSPRDRFQPSQSQFNRKPLQIPTPFNYNQGFNSNQDWEEEEKVEQDRFQFPPTRSNTTTQHVPPPFFSFNQGRQEQYHQRQTVERGDRYRDTARDIDMAVARTFDFYQDGYLRDHLLKLRQLLESFMWQPSNRDWKYIDSLLWELFDIYELKQSAKIWLDMWDKIRP